MVMLGIFINTSFLQVTMMLAAILRNPFCHDSSDYIKVNNILAGTDRCLFANMRGAFKEKTDESNHVDVPFIAVLPDTTKSGSKVHQQLVEIPDVYEHGQALMRKRRVSAFIESSVRQKKTDLHNIEIPDSTTTSRRRSISRSLSGSGNRRRSAFEMNPTKAREI